MKDHTQNPYVGPRPFERQDSARFFGRDREASELLSLIVANRVVVLYAQSGAGKTSLLNAQVAPLLEEEGFEVWPFARVQGPDLTEFDPSRIDNIYTFYTLFSWAGQKAEAAVLSTETILDYLRQRPHAQDDFGYEQPRLLIFDQFEELFTNYPARWPEREQFINQVARALDEDPLLRVVFSLRDDYIAQLEPYAHLLPRNLGTRFRLERMRPGAALAAIRGPLRATERAFAPGVAEQLVEDLRAVRAETISGEIQTVTGEFIEPVQLQVVCQNLWEDLPPAVSTITEEHLRTFGDVDQALSSFYERAVSRALPVATASEETLRQWFEASLITPIGTRSTVYRGAKQTGGIANEAIEILENMHIIRGEFRAGSRWYELTHDRLIEPIQKSNREWDEARQQARVKRIRRLAISAVTMAVIIGLCGYALFFLQRALFEPADGEQIRGTAIALEAEAAGERATSVSVQETATVVQAEATAQATSAAGMATAQYFANQTATAEREAFETALAQTAVAQEATETAVYETRVAASATAVAANATGTVAAAEATRTASELANIREPVRPLRPGISIGSIDSGTAGTLSAFVIDEQGVFYLVGPDLALGTAGTPVLQPGPIDGGKPENEVASSIRNPLLSDLPVIDAESLVNLAQLEPGIVFQTSIPDVGPILGIKEPQLSHTVWVYGRTSGLVQRQINCLNCSLELTANVVVNASFLLSEPLSPGDEGALVIDNEGYAVGIITTNTTETAVGASMTAIFDHFAEEIPLDVELVTAGQQTANFIAHDGFAWDVAYTPDGRFLATGGEDELVRLWDSEDTLAPPDEFAGHTHEVLALSFSPDGQWLATAGKDHTVRFWNVTGSGLTATPLQTGHSSWIFDLAISPDGRLLATASQDGDVRLWRLTPRRSEEPIAILTDHTGEVFSVAFSPDGRFLASASWDGTVRLWDVTTDEVTAVDTFFHDNWVFGLAFSPDGQWLASASADGLIHLWDLTTTTNPAQQIGPSSPNGIILADIGTTARSLAFSPDGKTLAAGTDDHLIYQWDLDDPEAPPLILDSGQRVTAVAYHPQSTLLATSLIDGRVIIWLVR